MQVKQSLAPAEEGQKGCYQACLAGACLYLPSDLHGVEIASNAAIVPGLWLEPLRSSTSHSQGPARLLSVLLSSHAAPRIEEEA